MATDHTATRVIPGIHEDNIKYMQDNSGEENGLHIFKDFEIQKMQRNLAYWRENADASTQNKKNFYAFFNEHDRRRQTRLLKHLP